MRGARVHNLKGVDLDIPRDSLVVLTGVSGSGKSSLAFDTLYAEGQRRFLETLSSNARQFLDQLERPEVDSIEGLPPTVAIDHRSGSTNSRSTVGTITEIQDYLRLLFARTGIPHCPNCGRAIRRQTPAQMVDTVLGLKEGRKVLLLAPIIKGQKGQHPEAFQAVRRAGLIRARVDGTVVEIGAQDPKLAKSKVHHIEAVVDRLVIREGIRPRLGESIDLALKLGDGAIIVSAQSDTDWEDETLSVNLTCTGCGTSFPQKELEPRSFSFNSPHGACPTCQGIGKVISFDPDLVLPDRSLSLEGGAVRLWADPAIGPEPDWVEELTRKYSIERTTPIEKWLAPALTAFLEGTKERIPGLLPWLRNLEAGSRSLRRLKSLAAFKTEERCPECKGTRLRAETRGVTIGGRTLPEISSADVSTLPTIFESLIFPSTLEKVGPPLVAEIIVRLHFLIRVGLGYLSLDRGSDTLSGGEFQRVRLATQLGSGLTGVCYILDEPTAGLHPRDTERMLACLSELRDGGNSVIVVEHDEATIRAADWIVDLGPGAGPEGGEVVALGSPQDLKVSGVSLTEQYLNKTATIRMPSTRRLEQSAGHIKIIGASARNLKSIDVDFPWGCLTCVSGVSGSGKSTLVHEVLAKAARNSMERRRGPLAGASAVIGLESFESLVEIDQSPIGRSPRSTPATFTGAFDEIRRIFARTREAKVRGYGSTRFSFNLKGGRCERCEGQGLRKIGMQLLPDLYVRCEECGGKRFNRQTLEILFKGHSVGDVLEMRVDESRELFAAQPWVLPKIDALHQAGLGYLTLGQSSMTLSGGEAQRVKLASELYRPSTGKTLYIRDEPTTGLHFADVERLLKLLHALADKGNTVVVIEHNPDVLKSADWLIDLGPEASEEGGYLTAMGTPQDIALVLSSATGLYLKP